MFDNFYLMVFAVLCVLFGVPQEVRCAATETSGTTNSPQICNLVFKNLNNTEIEEYSTHLLSSVESDAVLKADICHLIVALNPGLLMQIQQAVPEVKPIDEKPQEVTKLTTHKPFSTTTTTLTTPKTTTRIPTTAKVPLTVSTTATTIPPTPTDKLPVNPSIPLFEDQMSVFPLSINEHELEPIQIIEETLKTHPNGTLEYKLVLSNGVINYRRSTTKLVNGTNVQVHEGFNTIPLLGNTNQFQTQHYVSNEKGHHVYKVEQYVKTT